MSYTHELLTEIDAFLSRTGMAESTFGREAVKDWRFVRDLRSGGRRVWPETAERVRAFMTTWRPETADAGKAAA